MTITFHSVSSSPAKKIHVAVHLYPIPRTQCNCDLMARIHILPYQ